MLTIIRNTVNMTLGGTLDEIKKFPCYFFNVCINNGAILFNWSLVHYSVANVSPRIYR